MGTSQGDFVKYPRYDLFKQWAVVKRNVLEERFTGSFYLENGSTLAIRSSIGN